MFFLFKQARQFGFNSEYVVNVIATFPSYDAATESVVVKQKEMPNSPKMKPMRRSMIALMNSKKDSPLTGSGLGSVASPVSGPGAGPGQSDTSSNIVGTLFRASNSIRCVMYDCMYSYTHLLKHTLTQKEMHVHLHILTTSTFSRQKALSKIFAKKLFKNISKKKLNS